jgi:hypothetical protein
MSVDLFVMLLLSLLLMMTGGDDLTTVQLVLEGQHEAPQTGALIVGDATVTIPEGSQTSGPIHVIAGQTTIAGTVEGDVTLIAGTLDVADDATITGTLQHIGGNLNVAPMAEIGRSTRLEVAPADPSLGQRFLPVALVTALLALLGARLVARRPQRLDNVGDAVTSHPLVAVTVGLLAAVTAISLFVFMAFTLILLPVSLLGLAAGLVAIAYGIVALGHLTGRHLPIARAGRATAAGVVVVMVAFQLLASIPIAGDLVVMGMVLAGLGAVLLTYFGLTRFVPATLPE